MSKITNYDVSCTEYDSGREATGADILLWLMVKYSAKQIQDIQLLDVGCGTGNYAKYFMDQNVKQLSLIDASSGMIDVCKHKLGIPDTGSTDRVCIKQTILPAIPFENQTFDAVMTNMVIHHLDENPDGENFPNIEKTLSEVYRVIKHNGVFLISTQTSIQFKSRWLYSILPERRNEYSKCLPDNHQLIAMLQKTGFKVRTLITIMESENSNYIDTEKFNIDLTKNTDSFWSGCSEHQISTAMQLLKKLKQEGQLKEFVEKHDKSQLNGDFCIIVAQKI